MVHRSRAWEGSCLVLHRGAEQAAVRMGNLPTHRSAGRVAYPVAALAEMPARAPAVEAAT